jgi:hypothetical protein
LYVDGTVDLHVLFDGSIDLQTIVPIKAIRLRPLSEEGDRERLKLTLPAKAEPIYGESPSWLDTEDCKMVFEVVSKMIQCMPERPKICPPVQVGEDSHITSLGSMNMKTGEFTPAPSSDPRPPETMREQERQDLVRAIIQDIVGNVCEEMGIDESQAPTASIGQCPDDVPCECGHTSCATCFCSPKPLDDRLVPTASVDMVWHMMDPKKSTVCGFWKENEARTDGPGRVTCQECIKLMNAPLQQAEQDAAKPIVFREFF